MELGFIAITVVMTILGVIAGLLIGKCNTRTKETQGVLNVDYSDPEDGPYLFLELNTPIADVVSREQVVLDVAVTQYVSHK